MLKIILGTSCIFFSVVSLSQDIQFSQFYNAQLYQNPGFAGATHLPRATSHSRIQWPSLDAKYITSLVSFDGFSSKYKSGYGGYVLKDWQGGNNITSTEVALQYAYEINLSSKVTVRPGLQVGYANRSLAHALTVPEDYTANGQISDGRNNPGGGKQYADVSSGGILYSKKVWLGFSAHHLNTPNTSFTGEVAKLPAKYSFTAGYRIVFNKDPYQQNHLDYSGDDRSVCLMPTAHYKFQGTSDQLDLGVYGLYKHLAFGFWYRGIPMKNYSRGLSNNECLITSVGYKSKLFAITYSYDYTISRLTRVGTGGSHELNITYLHKKHKRHKIMKRLPCPNFG